jgi:hypothetical protein
MKARHRASIGGATPALLALAIGATALRPADAIAAPAPEPLVLSSFKLKGSHGYSVEAIVGQEGNFPKTVGIIAQREGLSASYELPGQLERGMHADFGTVGRVAMDFHRTKRTVDKLEKGCTYVKEIGEFRGEFIFLGEGGYTVAEASSAPGVIVRLPNGFCGFGRRGRSLPSFLSTDRLVARSRAPHGFVEVEATADALGAKSGISADVHESVGAMTIIRSASGYTGKRTLLLGPGKRPHRATVSPSSPFVGSARFDEPADGPATWTGRLSISLPGAPRVSLAGTGFAARLCLHVSLLAACKVPLPPRPAGGARLQGSGSHSQALADVRLSWSR